MASALEVSTLVVSCVTLIAIVLVVFVLARERQRLVALLGPLHELVVKRQQK